jgi:hypothetical protein
LAPTNEKTKLHLKMSRGRGRWKRPATTGYAARKRHDRAEDKKRGETCGIQGFLESDGSSLTVEIAGLNDDVDGRVRTELARFGFLASFRLKHRAGDGFVGVAVFMPPEPNFDKDKLHSAMSMFAHRCSVRVLSKGAEPCDESESVLKQPPGETALPNEATEVRL